MIEEWRPAPGFARSHEVSSLGRVRRAGTSRPLALKLHPKHRYWVAVLTVANVRKYPRVNRLVCEAFHGPPPSPRHQAAHDNGDRGNNRADNLAWKTQLENEADKDRHGTRPLGEQHPLAKITRDDAAAIRARWPSETLDQIAADYPIGRAMVHKIVRNHNWTA